MVAQQTRVNTPYDTKKYLMICMHIAAAHQHYKIAPTIWVMEIKVYTHLQELKFKTIECNIYRSTHVNFKLCTNINLVTKTHELAITISFGMSHVQPFRVQCTNKTAMAKILTGNS